MKKGVKWVTLTAEERALVNPAAAFRADTETTPGGLASHTCQVSLPNGQTCCVSYVRLSAQSHQFTFEHPLHQTLSLHEPIEGGGPGIEAQAQALLQ